jgi:hypothetical protein
VILFALEKASFATRQQGLANAKGLYVCVFSAVNKNELILEEEGVLMREPVGPPETEATLFL